MTSLNFMDVLDQGIDTIEKPPLVPMGAYIWAMTGHSSETTGSGEWDILSIRLKCVAPSESVDADDLTEYGDVTGVMRSKKFMFDKNDQNKFDGTMYNVKQFLLIHCGVDVDESASMAELLAAGVGTNVMAEITHTADKTDPEIQYDNIGKSWAVD